MKKTNKTLASRVRSVRKLIQQRGEVIQRFVIFEDIVNQIIEVSNLKIPKYWIQKIRILEKILGTGEKEKPYIEKINGLADIRNIFAHRGAKEEIDFDKYYKDFKKIFDSAFTYLWKKFAIISSRFEKY